MKATDDVAKPDLRVLVVTGGHPFEMEPFLDVLRALKGISWEPEPPRFELPPPGYASGIVEMLEAGQGIVFLHHAMSAWPAWSLWPKIVGGRWHYMPGELDGTQFPASGYTRELEHHILAVDPGHPICAGLEEGFSIVDEVYLNPVLTEIIHPILRTDYPMDSSAFFSGQLAITGHMYSSEGWSHPPGTGLVGWVKTAGQSPIAYLQPGHGPAAYGNAAFRTLLSNAIGWVASDDAREWARANPFPLT